MGRPVAADLGRRGFQYSRAAARGGDHAGFAGRRRTHARRGDAPMNRFRGVALITALLVTALAGSVAANMAWDNALDWRRTMVMLYRDQAIQVAVGSEGWVQTILRDDLASSENDHLEEIWATDIPV